MFGSTSGSVDITSLGEAIWSDRYGPSYMYDGSWVVWPSWPDCITENQTLTFTIYYKSTISGKKTTNYTYSLKLTWCFVEGTKVLTPNGLVKIEDIQVGDSVISMNLETFETEISMVKEKFVSQVNNKTCTIIIDGHSIESTQGHQYFAKKKGWISASKLVKGDILIDEHGNDVVIENVVNQESEGLITVYNMEIEKNHNYFVGDSQVLVHNEFSCFVAGTKVFTPNGYKNIEDIQIGDIVYSMNLATMEVEEKAVEKLKITENAIRLTYLISTEESCIESTVDHRFYVKDRGWIDACELEVGDILMDDNGSENEVTDVQTKVYEEPITVYNFEVEDNRNYFVGEDNILVYTIPEM